MGQTSPQQCIWLGWAMKMQYKQHFILKQSISILVCRCCCKLWVSVGSRRDRTLGWHQST